MSNCIEHLCNTNMNFTIMRWLSDDTRRPKKGCVHKEQKKSLSHGELNADLERDKLES